MQNTDIKTITIFDELYPKQYAYLDKPPANLYVLGNLDLLLSEKSVAIVGTRKATSYGKLITHELASTAGRADIPVISGLALGIDTQAHLGALASDGPTIAVLPGSLDQIYPRSNYSLARRIVDNGGLLISEYHSSEHPFKYQFLERNRLIAALCSHAIVTEAENKSGSYYTIEMALKLGKSVGAVPGDINIARSAGPNRWIKSGAEPILDIDDFSVFVGFNKNFIKSQYTPENHYEENLLHIIKQAPIDSDELLNLSKYQINELNIHLGMLEIKGAIQLYEGKWIIR